jgi:hypothetical protein
MPKYREGSDIFLLIMLAMHPFPNTTVAVPTSFSDSILKGKKKGKVVPVLN